MKGRKRGHFVSLPPRPGMGNRAGLRHGQERTGITTRGIGDIRVSRAEPAVAADGAGITALGVLRSLRPVAAELHRSAGPTGDRAKLCLFSLVTFSVAPTEPPKGMVYKILASQDALIGCRWPVTRTTAAISAQNQ